MTTEDLHQIFKRHYQELCRFAYIIMGSKDAADEVVQKTFIKLWDGRKSFRIKKDIKSYLYISVRNIALNNLKSSKARRQYEQEYSEIDMSAKNKEVDSSLFNKKLKEAISELPERCRAVYSLKYIEGLDYEEIAKYMNISKNTVDNHLQKALKKLRENLGEYKADFFNA